MSIEPALYWRARHIAESAAPALLAGVRPDPRGRPTLDPTIWLTGLLLTIDTQGMATITDVHRTLTQGLPRDLQWDLGVLTGPAHAPEVLTEEQLYTFSRTVGKKLNHDPSRAGQLDPDERTRRIEALEAISAGLLDATLTVRPESSADYALDGTGIWAHERALRPAVDTATTTDDAAAPAPAPAAAPPVRPRRARSDAAHGGKTSKDGKTEWFYGYDVEAMIRVPSLRKELGPHSEPTLVERLVVLPASTDIVDPCLRLIDLIRASGADIKGLLVDRHYSYKKMHRWLNQLLRRGIHQVADARVDEHGWRDWDGMKVAHSAFHCPCAPERLGSITPPALNATQAQKDEFAEKIAERQQYTCQVVNQLNADGRTKVRCPARNGTLGCPLVPGTVAAAAEAGIPVVDPPASADRPRMCSQDTVTITVETEDQRSAMKLAQRLYWGSPAWRTSYNRRTFIEGWFGVLKSKSATGANRGYHQFSGLAHVTIVASCAAAITNMRLLRSWHDETGLGPEDHPLLQPEQPNHGWRWLTAEEANLLDTLHAPLLHEATPRRRRRRPRAA